MAYDPSGTGRAAVRRVRSELVLEHDLGVLGRDLAERLLRPLSTRRVVGTRLRRRVEHGPALRRSRRAEPVAPGPRRPVDQLAGPLDERLGGVRSSCRRRCGPHLRRRGRVRPMVRRVHLRQPQLRLFPLPQPDVDLPGRGLGQREPRTGPQGRSGAGPRLRRDRRLRALVRGRRADDLRLEHGVDRPVGRHLGVGQRHVERLFPRSHPRRARAATWSTTAPTATSCSCPARAARPTRGCSRPATGRT